VTGFLRVARVHHPVTTLGHGRRLGIWVQGCSVGCVGCMSQDTWDAAGGTSMPIAELAVRATQLAESGQLDGVTVTGGEPLQQADGTQQLLEQLQPLRSRSVDLLIYSGIESDIALATAPWLGELADLTVLGPYIASSPRTSQWAGSGNQRVTAWSKLAAERYGADAGAAPQLQVVPLDDGSVSIIGIPDRGDLGRLEHELSRRGVVLNERSWR
jgi:anaerobic ribonucleoside-triphosphate reductase activating protein